MVSLYRLATDERPIGRNRTWRYLVANGQPPHPAGFAADAWDPGQPPVTLGVDAVVGADAVAGQTPLVTAALARPAQVAAQAVAGFAWQVLATWQPLAALQPLATSHPLVEPAQVPSFIAGQAVQSPEHLPS